MHSSALSRYSSLVRLGLYVAAALMALLLLWSLPARNQARAQGSGNPAADGGPSSAAAPAPGGASSEPATSSRADNKAINIFDLAVAGGIFMIPIAGMSLLAVAMTIERILGLRPQRVLPRELVSGLGQLAGPQGTFDPRKAYRLCQQFPSAAANVIRVMLLKVGRPLTEIEAAVKDASQREADRLYANVRWLNLAASLSTMLGLIGTIQGMIMAFHQMTVMGADANRVTVLAAGIYTALVTTFAGLFVAIPALFVSHCLEGWIQSYFRQIDELIFSLLPQLERYEGRVRFSRQSADGDPMGDEKEPAAAAGR
jgi:biopolymer transport protein ExbB